MVRKTGSMIVKLKENLHTAAEASVSEDSRHAGTKTAEIHTPFGCEPAQNQMEALDDEMKNDFKWLINFDLRSVNLQDIDGQIDTGTSDILKNGTVNIEEIRKPSLKRRKYSKYLPYTYSELIRICLTEKGDSTVREIYNWISERFPNLKSSDIAWKNAIRHTLSVNPLFQKRKIHGKRHLWCWQPDYQKCSQWNTDISMQLENSGYTNTKEKYILPNTIREIENSDIEDKSTEMISSWYTIESDNNLSDSITRCTEAINSLKNESSEYFELEIPIISEITTENTNYTEPIEVRYLIDETVASIPVHIF